MGKKTVYLGKEYQKLYRGNNKIISDEDEKKSERMRLGIKCDTMGLKCTGLHYRINAVLVR